jgi:hypothetical protein
MQLRFDDHVAENGWGYPLDSVREKAGAYLIRSALINPRDSRVGPCKPTLRRKRATIAERPSISGMRSN